MAKLHRSRGGSPAEGAEAQGRSRQRPDGAEAPGGAAPGRRQIRPGRAAGATAAEHGREKRAHRASRSPTRSITLAGLYEAQSKFADAEPLLKRSLAIREKAPGQPGLAATRDRLAVAYDKLGKPDEASSVRSAAAEPAKQGRAGRPGRGRRGAQPEANVEIGESVEANGRAMQKKGGGAFLHPSADAPGAAAPRPPLPPPRPRRPRRQAPRPSRPSAFRRPIRRPVAPPRLLPRPKPRQRLRASSRESLRR